MATERPLTSDELGNLGESRFIHLCEEGKPQLIVNKALKDQSGWDFIVEFPHDNKQREGLDKRQNPVSSRFQQKTMWVDNDRVKFKLSSLERLAKDPGPSFICVLKYSNEIKCVECYIIHILDDFLAFVLEKLRQHEAIGEKSVNQVEVDVYPSRLVKCVDPAHESIVSAITSSVGNDINAYVRKKSDQVERLGFGPKPFDFSFTLPERERAKFTDSLLGESQEIEVTKVEGSATRFGIKLPLPGMTGRVTLNVSPAPKDTCDIIFSKEGFKASVVKAVMYSLPAQLVFENDQKRMRIAAKGVEIIFRQVSTDLKVKTSFPPEFTMTIREWRNHYGILEMMMTGELTVELRTRSKNFRGAKIRVRPYAHDVQFNEIAAAIDTFQRLLDSVGFLDAKLTFEEVADLQRQMLLGKALFEDGIATKAEAFELEKIVPPGLPEILSGVYFTFIDIGEHLFTMKCFIEGKIKDSTVEIIFSDPNVLKPEVMITSREEYDDLVSSSKGSAKTPLVLSSRTTW